MNVWTSLEEFQWLTLGTIRVEVVIVKEVKVYEEGSHHGSQLYFILAANTPPTIASCLLLCLPPNFLSFLFSFITSAISLIQETADEFTTDTRLAI